MSDRLNIPAELRSDEQYATDPFDVSDPTVTTGNPFQSGGVDTDVGEASGESVDVSTFTGLAFAPEAAFIEGADDTSSPADVASSAVGNPDTATDLPGVDEDNEVAETARQTEVVIEQTAPEGLVPRIRRLAALLLLGIAGLFGLQAFLKGLGSGVAG